MGTRARIFKGQLVRSTNEQQDQLAKELKIEHRYNPINFKRVARVVVQPIIEIVLDFENRRILEICK